MLLQASRKRLIYLRMPYLGLVYFLMLRLVCRKLVMFQEFECHISLGTAFFTLQ